MISSTSPELLWPLASDTGQSLELTSSAVWQCVLETRGTCAPLQPFKFPSLNLHVNRSPARAQSCLAMYVA